MAISKRELALSQDLMDLDRVYNELNRRYNNLNISHNDALNRLIVLESEKNELESEITILKEALPSAIAFTPKKRTRKTV